VTRLDDSAERRVIALLVLALAALVGRVVAGWAGAPPIVARALYLLALGSLVATVLVVATE
jgi:hypothetical protein